MDIVERLRAVAQGYVVFFNDHSVYTEAADEIERLRNKIERLQEALQMLVDEKCDYMKLNLLGDPEQQHTIKIARTALKEGE